MYFKWSDEILGLVCVCVLTFLSSFTVIFHLLLEISSCFFLLQFSFVSAHTYLQHISFFLFISCVVLSLDLHVHGHTSQHENTHTHLSLNADDDATNRPADPPALLDWSHYLSGVQGRHASVLYFYSASLSKLIYSATSNQ